MVCVHVTSSAKGHGMQSLLEKSTSIRSAFLYHTHMFMALCMYTCTCSCMPTTLFLTASHTLIVCPNVCMPVCLDVCQCASMYASVPRCMPVCLDVCQCAPMYAHCQAWPNTSYHAFPSERPSPKPCQCVGACVYVRVTKGILKACACLQVSVCICVCICVSTHAHIIMVD